MCYFKKHMFTFLRSDISGDTEYTHTECMNCCDVLIDDFRIGNVCVPCFEIFSYRRWFDNINEEFKKYKQKCDSCNDMIARSDNLCNLLCCSECDKMYISCKY